VRGRGTAFDSALPASPPPKRPRSPPRENEDRNREQLFEVAKEKNIRGRSKMGKWELIRAIRRAS
jgi:hypothetical protein